MVDLEWHEFYEIGVDFIDAEHKKILSIMRDIHEMLMQADFDKLAHLSESLLRESENHFKNEEDFLQEVKYPKLIEHSAYHAGLLQQAKRIKTICQGMKSDDDLMLCVEEMKNFLIDDILYGDVKFKSYLEYNGFVTGKF